MVFDWSLLEDEIAVSLPLVLHNSVFVVSFHLKFDSEMTLRFWGFGFNYEMVVAMRAVFVGFFELFDCLTEYLLTFFAGKDEFESFHEFMVIFPEFFVALWAVKPLLTARCSYCNLGVHNMFAHDGFLISFKFNYSVYISLI